MTEAVAIVVGYLLAGLAAGQEQERKLGLLFNRIGLK